MISFLRCVSRSIAAGVCLPVCLGITASARAADAPPPTSQPARWIDPRPLIAGATVIKLWPENSPKLKRLAGFDQPEQFAVSKNAPDHVNAVTNIHIPSIEVHLAPPDKANGSAIILAAGGGNKTLNVGGESTDLIPFFHNLGMSVFIERYRLRPYDSETDTLYDTQRSFKVVRAHAREWKIDPKRIGIMGFSAGGEQAARVGMSYDPGKPDDADPIEHESSRPDYIVLIYAGWKELNITVPKDAPPAFSAVAGVDDMFHSTQTMDFTNAWLRAKIPTELHLYGHGGHARAMQPRNGIPFGTWQNRFTDWVKDLGMLNADRKPQPVTE